MALLVALVWLPVLDGGYFWDDSGNFTDNAWLDGAWSTFWPASLSPHLGHWQPLTWWSLRLDGWLLGDGPRPHLIGNVVLHALSAGVLVALSAALLACWPTTAQVPQTARSLAAGGAALLWAIHPCRVESVAWPTERRDVLATLLLLLGLLAWLRGRVAGPSSTRRWAWLLAAAAFAASAMAKAWVVALPGALFALELTLLANPSAGAKALLQDALAAIRRTLPWLLLSLPVAVVAATAQRGGGAAADVNALDIADRLMLAASGIGHYVMLTLWPANLSPLHPIVADTLWGPMNVALAAAAVALTVALVAAAARRSNAIALPALGAWVGFVAWLSPVLGLSQSGVQAYAERYLVVAHVPVALLLAIVIARPVLDRPVLGRPVLGRPVLGRPVLSWALLVVVLLATLSTTLAWQQTWRAGPLALWDAAIAAEPRSPHALANRAALKLERGDVVGAQADVDAALALSPRFANAWKLQAELARRGGDRQGALAALDRAVAAAASDGVVRCNRAALRAELGDADGAMADFDAALAGAAGPDCRLNRAVARVGVGDVAGARADVEAALLSLPEAHPLRERALGMARALAKPR